MHTEHVQYELMDYIANRLGEQERRRVEDHLNSCDSCTQEYQELTGISSLLHQQRPHEPAPAYYAGILPRVRERLASHWQAGWDFSRGLTNIVLPLAVGAFLVILFIYVPTDFTSEYAQTDALHQAVKDFNDDDILQALEKEYTGSSISPGMEVAAAGVAEHLQSDKFLKSAVSKQLEDEEIAEIDVEGIMSELNSEQVDQVLTGLSERKSL